MMEVMSYDKTLEIDWKTSTVQAMSNG